MIAEVNQEECIGCESCPEFCPEVFRMEADGLAVAYTNPVPSEFEAAAQEAADGCPAHCIIIT
ncbi:ferredoxin [Desulfosporosinus sp. BICA1-9]|uniref:ferredoxin n=1 Tax=Desulfosporosinus sp. BICA1-9 TaxID=1531958 RepID=UPI00054C4C45|nr:ferredoxin [Desulfosporosinus sp. BICA1-9]KJS47444.1 MAG: ferredoxin [Peptococcaceae bacterium BRH_c23]KJS89048.1 MAG: ferredoxin [Desulfosporosinus sp. BICA1-9]HBW37454.1 ferredoxin [Desulfosporosinus sp.]